jgi:hypothetical protein
MSARRTRCLWSLGRTLSDRTAAILQRPFGEAATTTPLCTTRMRSGGGGSLHPTQRALSPRLAVVRPDLAAEWVVELNDDADVGQVQCNHDGYPVWWRCSNCGNTWKATVTERVDRERGCPHCDGSFGSAAAAPPQPADVGATATTGEMDKSEGLVAAGALASSHPHIASRWHPTRNGSLRPEDVTAACGNIVWWMGDDSSDDASFQRSIAQFVLDPRSPQKKAADCQDVEQALLNRIADVTAAPFVPTPEPRYCWSDEDTATVLSHLLTMSQRTPRGEPVATTNHGATSFPNQPMQSVEDALRSKAISFFVHKFVDGKRGSASSAFSTITEATITDAMSGREIPSYAFVPGGEDDEATEWRSYFSLAPQEASAAWNLKFASGAPSSPAIDTVDVIAKEETRDGHDAAPPYQQETSTACTQQIGSAAAGVVAAPRAYPRKPKANFFSPPVEHTAQGGLIPRRVAVLRRGGSSSSRGSAVRDGDTLVRDEDGGRASFGRFDERFLDESEALDLYDNDGSGGVVGGKDLLDSVGEPSLKDRQYNRQKSGQSIRPQRHTNPRHMRRPFEMRMPSELEATVNATTVHDEQQQQEQQRKHVRAEIESLPNAPRVVARPKRRVVSTDDGETS